jgi:hypothetical protein
MKKKIAHNYTIYAILRDIYIPHNDGKPEELP